MKRDSLDFYDKKPPAMVNYLRYNGMHFNKKMCDFAVSKMYRYDSNHNKEYIHPIDKESLDALLKDCNVNIENNQMYDYVYVANMCKADFLGSSIKNGEQLSLYVKDVIDDPDAYDGLVFNRWYADTCRLGLPIDWDSML